MSNLTLNLTNPIIDKVYKANEQVQLRGLLQMMDKADTTERFLADTLYNKLLEHTFNKDDHIEMEEDIAELLREFPIYSIQTVTSYNSEVLKSFTNRLTDDKSFTGHISVKLNGLPIRLIYRLGKFYKAVTKKGRDVTQVVQPCIENANCITIDDFDQLDIVEVRGELVINKDNLETVQKATYKNISSFTGVGLICNSERTDLYQYLNFLAFGLYSDGVIFSTKTEEYQYLEELGFEVPMYWFIEDLKKETLIEDLQGIVSDCEVEVRASDVQDDYDYLTDGLIFTIDDKNYFDKLGHSLSRYQYGNMTLRIGYWQQQTTYKGYIQTIYWKQGDSQMMPYAVVSDKPNQIEFDDLGVNYYTTNIESIVNLNNLGVETENGKVNLVPLYNPNQILRLDAYVDTTLEFVNDRILGVLPCFEDGRVLLDGLLQEVIMGQKQFN